MTSIAALQVADDLAAWERLGIATVSGSAVVAGVELQFRQPAGERGIVGWTLVGAPADTDEVDGLPTRHAPADWTLPAATAESIGVTGFDHVVVMTSSLDRTCAAVEAATGAPLRRVREAGSMRQGFHRLGAVVLEVVESPQITAPTAAFWGFVWNVADLDGVADRLGPEILGRPKAAVQPGRRIATVRVAAGLGFPVALMTAP